MSRGVMDAGSVDVKVTVQVTHDHGAVHVVEEQRIYREGDDVSSTVARVTQRACSMAQASLEPERPGA